MDKHTEHIKDDLLSNLVKLSDEEKISGDFTQRVMQQIPKTAIAEPEEKYFIKPWQWMSIAAAAVAIIYFIITFDLSSILSQTTNVSDDGSSIYLSMFTSIIEIFTTAFSGFQFTSISVMIIISGVGLYLGDKFFRKWSESRSVALML